MENEAAALGAIGASVAQKSFFLAACSMANPQLDVPKPPATYLAGSTVSDGDGSGE
jgi:hypothetical protein